jgi:hypothetical protein
MERLLIDKPFAGISTGFALVRPISRDLLQLAGRDGHGGFKIAERTIPPASANESYRNIGISFCQTTRDDTTCRTGTNHEIR